MFLMCCRVSGAMGMWKLKICEANCKMVHLANDSARAAADCR